MAYAATFMTWATLMLAYLVAGARRENRILDEGPEKGAIQRCL